MKVVMDAVFNHTGKEFFAFKDILEKGEKSKYLDWYYIDELPLKGEWGEIPNFLCFGYYGGMPKLNLKIQRLQTTLRTLHAIGSGNVTLTDGDWM